MAFKSVWGFDPDEGADANHVPAHEPCPIDFSYSLAEQQAAQIPPDPSAQVRELRRMFRS